MTKIEEDMVRERIVRRGIHMSKVIMVVFDGLQPSQVSEELTPNIHGVASKGCFFEDHHCVFPSVTRANVATLMTGTHPGVHGLLGNNFIDVTYDPTRVISASNTEFDHMNKYDHEILNAKTMYQILQEFNMSYMAIGVGTTGNAYLHHVGGGDSDSNSGTIHPEFSNPSFLSEDILVKFGPWPEEEVPNNVRFSHAMDIFIEYILGEKNPEVALIWSSEPDKSQHAYGVGHHLSNSALEHADKEFGRLLEKLGSNFMDSNTLMILSDHGYSTIEEVIEVEKIIINAGFRIGTGKGELLLALNGGSALISVGGSDVDTADRLVSWLMKQKWCGNILAGDRIGPIDGTIPLSKIGLGGPRSPDIVFSLNWNSRANQFKFQGRSASFAGAAGQGTHGSISPHEMNNVLICDGPYFGKKRRILTPSGNIDVLPTILDILGVESPHNINGRILKEAYKDTANELVFERNLLKSERTIEDNVFKQEIILSQLGGSIYIDEGSVLLE